MEVIRLRVSHWALARWPNCAGSVMDIFRLPNSSGLARIGGVLRDHLSNYKLIFSKSVGSIDSNLAEIMAAMEAVFLFSRSDWVRTHKLILETDPINVVKWLTDPQSTPWRMRRYVAHISNLVSSFAGWSVVHVYRRVTQWPTLLRRPESTEHMTSFFHFDYFVL
ncbi:hypothetical protein DITRI_Ditri03aG0144400 [Diplodiscus trichospermus]